MKAQRVKRRKEGDTSPRLVGEIALRRVMLVIGERGLRREDMTIRPHRVVQRM